MTGPVRMALAFLPLASYFFVLGVWQGGARPRVVSGPRDFALLAFGLGGLIAFGPIGQFLVAAVFPAPTFAAWLAVASLVGLLAMVAAIPTRTRLVVYHVEAPDLAQALGRAVERVTGPATRTLRGFEDGPSHRGVTVEFGHRLRFGVVQAYGQRPEALIEAIRPALAEELRGVVVRPTRLATIWFGLSCAVILAIPLALALLARPEVRAAIRRMGGG